MSIELNKKIDDEFEIRRKNILEKIMILNEEVARRKEKDLQLRTVSCIFGFGGLIGAPLYYFGLWHYAYEMFPFIYYYSFEDSRLTVSIIIFAVCYGVMIMLENYREEKFLGGNLDSDEFLKRLRNYRSMIEKM